MAKVDLKDAFFMVPVAPQHCHLLLFNLEMKTFQFKCLSRVIPKILKPVIERLRSLGVYLVVCMDDILIITTAVEMLREHIHVMLFLLENLGFIINSKKSLLTPTQEIEFLVMVVNSQTMDLKLPGEKSRKSG